MKYICRKLGTFLFIFAFAIFYLSFVVVELLKVHRLFYSEIVYELNLAFCTLVPRENLRFTHLSV